MVIAKSMGTFLNPVNKKCVSPLTLKNWREEKSGSFQKEDDLEPAEKTEPAPLISGRKEPTVPAIPMQEKPTTVPLLQSTACRTAAWFIHLRTNLIFCSSCGTRLEENIKEIMEPGKTPVISTMALIKDVTVAKPSSQASVTEEPSAVTSDASSKVPQKSELKTAKRSNTKGCSRCSHCGGNLRCRRYMHFFSGSSGEKKTQG